MYGITFLTWYLILWWFAHKRVFVGLPRVHRLLSTGRDDLFLACMLGVILWGRLGEIILYDSAYYRQHPEQMLAFWSGGMSFLWGVIGVVVALLYIKRRYRLQREDFGALGDAVVTIVPLGSLLWRIWNFLNQELIGRPVSELPVWLWSILDSLSLTYVYDRVDDIVRVNSNILQSIGEWLVLGIIVRIFFSSYYLSAGRGDASRKTQSRPLPYGRVGAVFLIWYGVIRFVMEFFKDLPQSEVYGVLSWTQVLVIPLIIIGIWLWRRARVA